MSRQKRIKQLTQVDKRRLIESRLRSSPELSNRAIARMIGVSPTTVGKYRSKIPDKIVQTAHLDTQANDWSKHPYLLANPDILDNLSEASLRALKAPCVLDKMQERGSKSPRYCQRLLYLERKEANKHPDVKIVEGDVSIFQGDATTGLPEIDDESVDLVFVDPPYDRKSVESLYSNIASVAERILVDGGSLLVMSGGAHLDIAIRELSASNKTLRFNWDIAYVCNRGIPLVYHRRVTTAVKHILWYVKGDYTGSYVYDLIQAPHDPHNKDKDYHEWGQSVEVVKELIEKLTKPGYTVCDFMVGGGSTAVASVLSNRKFIGCDIDPEAVKTTRSRVDKLFGAE